MTRRSQGKKKRTKSGRNQHQQQQQSSHESTPSTSLEEDLKQQRIRQQQREEEQREQKEEQARHEALQKMEQEQEQARHRQLNDELQHRRPTPQQLMFKGLSRARVNESQVRLPPAFTLGSVQETSCMMNAKDRTYLRYLWHSQHLLDNATVNSRAFLFYGKKHKSLVRELPDGMYCSWDLTGKPNIENSMRTMDVAMLHTAEDLPMIASIVDGGWSLFNPYGSNDSVVGNDNDNIQVNKGPPTCTVRCHGSSRRMGLVRYTGRSREPYEFLLYSLPNTGTMLKTLDLMTGVDAKIGDFCIGKDVALFARQPMSGSIWTTVPPIYFELGRGGGSIFQLKTENFPSSDSTRIEMSCEGGDRHLAVGHRNGQVSLIDLRASRSTWSMVHCEESESSSRAGTPLGSVMDMCFVSDQDSRQLLIRRAHGSHQLHDLRMSATTTNSQASYSSSSSLLWNMAPPVDAVNASLTTRCNGFALDPIGKQTMISPYINADRDAVVGVWSLKTGLMVGSKLLKKAGGDNDVLYAEMCQRVTPSYSTHGKTMKKVWSSASSWGAWLKCGAVTTDKTNLNVGSLYHVSFPGHWKQN